MASNISISGTTPVHPVINNYKLNSTKTENINKDENNNKTVNQFNTKRNADEESLKGINIDLYV